MKTLLDADYTVEEGKAVVRLYYKTEEGRVVEDVRDFEPYFYALPEKDGSGVRIREGVSKLEGVVKVEEKKVMDLGEQVAVLRITTRLPADVPKLRDEVKKIDGVHEVREAAIPFARRYLTDSGLTPMEGAEEIGLTVCAVDIETDHAGKESRENRIIMLSYADNRGLKKVWTYRKPDEVSLEYLEVVGNEAEVIKKLVETVRDRGVDIICGYNTDNFDFPFIGERADKLGVKLSLGIDGSDVRMERRGMNSGARIRGRPHVDLYPVCRQTFNIPRYRLEDVYEHITGEVKEDIEVQEILEYFNSDKREEYETLASYSLSDVEATLKIAETVLPLQYEISRVIREPLYETSRMSSSQRVEQLLVNKAFEKGILVPNRPSDRVAGERSGEKYVGAYVVEPERGIHDNIVLFDFRSLYPSIIISHNVDPSTIDCKCCKSDAFKAPTGHYFCKKNRGFIPEVLEWLIKKRVEVKGRLKSEPDAGKKRVLDVQQQALKLLANSMYGYYAFIRARWFSRDCAEAITAWGREYIHKAMDAAKKAGFDVIYGDTDSVYLTRPNEKDKKKIVEDAKKFQKEINKELPEAMELEFEGFYPRGIFITKKRYALIDEQDALTVKGLETRRRDWAEIAKDTQRQVLNALLKDKDPDKAAEIVKETVARIKEGKVPLRELSVNTQLTRGIGDYVSPGPHVIAVKKAMKEGMDFGVGSIITYVITRKGSSISDKARVIDFVEEGDYDADYYVNNQVIPAVSRILEALGYSEDELKGLGKQMTLGDW